MDVVNRWRTALRLCLPVAITMGCFLTAIAADERPVFFRGLNLNGPALEIDGHAWEGAESEHYVCNDRAFENQQVTLIPATDASRAQMLRSSRWGGNRVELTDVPSGIYSVFLYVWEDNHSETYSIDVNGRRQVTGYQSGAAGHWDKLGPWYVEPRGGKIVITSQGGAANFSGIEIWRGRHEGNAPPTVSPEELSFFESRIRPVLVDRCYQCHSHDADEVEGDLLVDSAPTLLSGGASGAAIVPGDSNKSLLFQRLRADDEAVRMPPDQPLSAEQIADFDQWIKRGAVDPRTVATKRKPKIIDLAEARKFWSLKPIVVPPAPLVKDTSWPRNDVDRFVLSRLEAQQLTPAGDADRRALIRRATYDLTGLPPTPAEVYAFLTDTSEQAFEKVVERLLASPRYGERWGRHWLDIVRYADTAGDNSDFPIPQMVRYRDWVIDAINHDLPYDEFVRDQLAGDLRVSDTEEDRYRRIIATGYLAGARRFGSRVDDYPWHLTIEDTIDNLGRTFLGITLSCSRCHDHKFDPVTMDDYYGLYGIFQSTKYPWPGIELEQRQRDLVALAPADKSAEVKQTLNAFRQTAKN